MSLYALLYAGVGSAQIRGMTANTALRDSKSFIIGMSLLFFQEKKERGLKGSAEEKYR